MKQLLSQLSNYLCFLEKSGGGGVHIKENTLILKLRVCTLSSYSLYNSNLNMFWSAAKIIQIVPVSKYIQTWLYNEYVI